MSESDSNGDGAEQSGEETTAFSVKVPDVGEGVAEVEVVSWSVEPGQRVTRHQIVAEVMTDKATVEVPSPVDGVIADLAGDIGDVLLVGESLFVLDLEGADPPAGVEVESRPVTGSPGRPATKSHGGTPANAKKPVSPGADTEMSGLTTSLPPPPSDSPLPTASATAPNAGQLPPRPEGQRPTASPAVRRRARDAGLDLRTVAGSGPAGRITHADIDALFAGATTGARPTASSPRRQQSTEVVDQPIVGIRRKIAERMVNATTSIPHITYVDELDVTALEELRTTLNGQASTVNAAASRLTLLPFLIKALVEVLPEFPAVNAHIVEGQPGQPAVLRKFGGVHVGVATQTDAGLVVPVIRHAEAETLRSLADRLTALATAARAGTTTPTELSGSTITISSLGPLGGLVTTPVINAPEVAIVGVNKIVTRPVWDGRDFVPRKMMNLSSSFDHRVIDGWDAAQFVQAIKRLVEQPALLFLKDE